MSVPGDLTVNYDAVNAVKSQIDALAQILLNDVQPHQVGTIEPDTPGNVAVAQQMDTARYLHQWQLQQVVNQLSTAAANLDTAVQTWQSADQANAPR